MSETMNVLVADDDPDVVEQLTIALRAEGWRVHAAASQKETEELLLSVRPDVAILDLMMEHLDSGIVLCHYLKRLYPSVPVILLTAVTAATGMSFAATGAGARSWVKADRVMDKPVRSEQIRSEVRRLTGCGEPAAAKH
jgi:two-component system, OmpR family, response regulator